MALLPPVLRLRVGQEAFLITGPKKTLLLSRTSPSIREVDGPQSSVTGPEEDIYGIVGIINLVSGRHLIVIKSCAPVGTIEGEPIWRVTKHSIIAFQPSKPSPVSPAQQQDEATYVRMLNFILRVPTLYFSHAFDLTNSSQRRMGTDADASKPIWRRADQRFFWNRYVMEELIAKELDAWIVPLVFGFVSITSLTVVNKQVDLVLISRRNVKRAGTRFYTRGVDAEGNVANNVETELMCYNGTQLWSFVQTRGSIPIFWSQFPNIRYKPKILLSKNESASLAFNRHFEEQQRRYGRQVIVNLVDQKPKSGEALLEQEYRRHAGLFSTTSAKTSSTPLKYIAFDFHKQCAKMQYKNLSILLREVEPEFDNLEYFRAEVNSTARAITNSQKGTLRTNCIDNLDRTNVVQAMHARYALVAQLRRVGVIRSGLEESPALEKAFKNMWADNADAISTQYSGTGALKNDFTRTGKRDMRGVLNDGVNAMVRYYLNNFVDGFRQDSYDLFLGNYVVDASRPSPFPSPREKSIYAALLAVALAMFIAGIMFFPQSESGFVWQLIFIVFWLLALFVVWKVLLKDGRLLVNRPALVKPT